MVHHPRSLPLISAEPPEGAAEEAPSLQGRGIWTILPYIKYGEKPGEAMLGGPICLEEDVKGVYELLGTGKSSLSMVTASRMDLVKTTACHDHISAKFINC
jgi:hypothetical protein